MEFAEHVKFDDAAIMHLINLRNILVNISFTMFQIWSMNPANIELLKDKSSWHNFAAFFFNSSVNFWSFKNSLSCRF